MGDFTVLNLASKQNKDVLLLRKNAYLILHIEERSLSLFVYFVSEYLAHILYTEIK